MNIIKYPLSTEKAIREMEQRNILVFIVDEKASKSDIQKEIESLFNVKIVNINTTKDMKGRKKAFVKFSPATPAVDIAIKLGLM